MTNRGVILIGEDNEDYAFLLKRALDKVEVISPIRILPDGNQILFYLQGLGAYANRQLNPLPALIILDLQMPRKSGFEVLEWLASNSPKNPVPTVVLTSSDLPADVKKAYHLGTNTYFVKPCNFQKLVELMKKVCDYWSWA